MGKKETKQTYADTRADKAESERRYEDARDVSSARITDMQPGMGAIRNDVESGYRNLAPAGTLSAPKVNTQNVSFGGVGWDNIGPSRTISSGNLDDVLSQYKNLGPAFNTAQQAAIGGDVSKLREFGNTGGLDAEATNRMRGLGVYDEFAKTGGYSDTDVANIKAQALSPISSIYGGLRNEMSRRRAVTGGYSPGFDASTRALSRDASRQITDTSLNANVGIRDRINAGRLQGTAGLVGAEQNLQGLKTGNQLAGLNSASQIEMGLQDRINQYKLAGLSGQQATAQALADVERANIANENAINIANAQGGFEASRANAMGGLQADSLNATAANQAAAFNASNEMNAGQFNINNAQAMQMAGIGGLQNLYNTDVGQYQNELDRQNSLLGGQTQSNLSYLNNQGQLAIQPGIGGNIINTVGAVAGAVAPIMPSFRASSAAGA